MKKILAEIESLSVKLAQSAATPEQAAQLEHFFKQEQHNVHPGPDQGTSILGNGIDLVVLEKGKRKPTLRRVFRNPWTQAEQSEALHKMIDAAKHKFPELKEFIRYNAGVMD